MKQFLPLVFILLVILFGCSNEEDKPLPNKTPKTYFWLFPDSTILEGKSRQQIHWWGHDPDGVIRGYLFAIGRLLDSTHHLVTPDTIGWCFTTKTDSTVAFPLVTKRDTFDIAVRAVDNTFKIPVFPEGDSSTFENAIVRLNPFPYWDRDTNGIYDNNDMKLETMNGAYDPVGATQPMPLKNQPPSITFAFDPNTLTDIFQQPDTTFTVATFAWTGADPDGDQTIAKYIIALNDTNLESQKMTLSSSISLVTLVVPRSVSDTATTASVTADVYSGTYRTPPTKRGTIGGLKLNAYNKFYVQAVDVAGDSSSYIAMPTGTAKWYVKKPKGRLLILGDYVGSDSDAVLSYYKTMFPQLGSGEFATFDVLNLAKGMSLEDKKNHKVGRNVPPFFDPALIFTLHLYDVVFCYTDMNPSLYVVQIPFYEYVHNTSHQGKIIYSYSMPFDTAANAARSLEEFAPVDSVSKVTLIGDLLYPIPGTNQIPGGSVAYSVFSDSSTTDYYPNLKFNSSKSTHFVYVRQTFKRSDARYIYHMQPDIRNPKRYAYGVSLFDFRSVTAVGSDAWACGQNGMIFHTSDDGAGWEEQMSGTSYQLNDIAMIDGSTGWAVGAIGTMLKTEDGGSSWSDHTIGTITTFNKIHFLTSSIGYIVGTYGSVLKTTNGFSTWSEQTVPTIRTLNDVKFVDANNGIIVGDSIALGTTDGGANWSVIGGAGTRTYYSVAFASPETAYAVGARGSVLQLVKSGTSWTSVNWSSSVNTTNDLRSIQITTTGTGWICGKAGSVYRTTNGGLTWSGLTSGITQPLFAVGVKNQQELWSVGAMGVILHSVNGGTNWTTQPPGVINVGVIDGQRSFVFLGLPLHLLDGNGTVKDFLNKVIFQEFGL